MKIYRSQGPLAAISVRVRAKKSLGCPRLFGRALATPSFISCFSATTISADMGCQTGARPTILRFSSLSMIGSDCLCHIELEFGT